MSIVQKTLCPLLTGRDKSYIKHTFMIGSLILYQQKFIIMLGYSLLMVKVKVKLRFLAPSAGIPEVAKR